MSNRNRIAELAKRVAALESIVMVRGQPDDVFNVGLEASNPKPIDWSKVAACVPVKVWDDDYPEQTALIYPRGTHQLTMLAGWCRHSLITGINIAWSGGECPLPNGVVVEVTERGGIVWQDEDVTELDWDHCEKDQQIISFRVTGIHPEWTEEVGE